MNSVLMAFLLVASQVLAAEPQKTDEVDLLDCLQVVHEMNPAPTPVQLAALNGDIASVRVFLEEPLKDPLQTQVWSLLRFAAVGGQLEIAKLLLKSGVNPLVRSAYMTSGNPRLVDRTAREAVLACGAIDKAEPRYAAIIALLQEEEAAVSPRSARVEGAIKEEDFETALSIVAEGPILDPQREQVVALAVQRNDLDMLRRLFDLIKGLRVPRTILSEIKNKPNSGLSATEKFVHEHQLRAGSSWLLFMLRHGGPIPAEKINALDKNLNNLTMLMHAAQYGQLELVKALLEKGADPGLKNLEGKTAFDLACVGNPGKDCEEIRRLLE